MPNAKCRRERKQNKTLKPYSSRRTMENSFHAWLEKAMSNYKDFVEGNRGRKAQSTNTIVTFERA